MLYKKFGARQKMVRLFVGIVGLLCSVAPEMQEWTDGAMAEDGASDMPGGMIWTKPELRATMVPRWYANCSEHSRPRPRQVLIEHGIHPQLGPQKIEVSRGQKEAVLGKEIGVGDAYPRPPMSSLEAALMTQKMRNGSPDDQARNDGWMVNLTWVAGNPSDHRGGALKRGTARRTYRGFIAVDARTNGVSPYRDYNLLPRARPARGKRKVTAE